MFHSSSFIQLTMQN